MSAINECPLAAACNKHNDVVIPPLCNRLEYIDSTTKGKVCVLLFISSEGFALIVRGYLLILSIIDSFFISWESLLCGCSPCG